MEDFEIRCDREVYLTPGETLSIRDEGAPRFPGPGFWFFFHWRLIVPKVADRLEIVIIYFRIFPRLKRLFLNRIDIVWTPRGTTCSLSCLHKKSPYISDFFHSFGLGLLRSQLRLNPTARLTTDWLGLAPGLPMFIHLNRTEQDRVPCPVPRQPYRTSVKLQSLAPLFSTAMATLDLHNSNFRKGT